MTDNVNHPEHYTSGEIECIDAIRAALTPEEFRGFCKGNVIKYAWRERLKGGNESLRKAIWYADKAIGEKRTVGDSDASVVDYADGEWHEWGGGECPVDTNAYVEYELRSGVEGLDYDQAWRLDWEHDDCLADIIRFRVVK